MVSAWTNLYYPEGGTRGQSLRWDTVRTSSSGSVSYNSGYTLHNKDVALRYHHSKNTRSAKGWIAPSTYKRVVAEMKHSPADYTISGYGYETRYLGYPTRTDTRMFDLCTFPIGTGWDCRSTEEVDRAVTETLLRLKDKKIDLGTALAESVKSANMVADAAKELWTLLLAVKRGQLPKGRKSSLGLDVASGFLEYKYGWKPLISDLYGLYEASRKKILDGREKIFSAERHISGSWEDSRDTQYWTNRVQHASVVGSCKIWARVNDSIFTTLNQYGLANPLSLAWELVPYSFVVDWGLPIGNYLEALNAAHGLTFVGGFKSIHCEGTTSGTLKGSGVRQGVEVNHLSLSRTKLTSFPSPVLYAKSPFSTGNVESALAIHRQLIGR